MPNLVFSPSQDHVHREASYTALKVQRDFIREMLSEGIDEINRINPSFFSNLFNRGAASAPPPQDAPMPDLRMMKVFDPPKRTEEEEKAEALKAQQRYMQQQKIKKKQKYAKGADKLKAMWRRIAAECHPDKTKDKDKNGLYQRAVEARDNLDEDALAHLLAELTSGSIDNSRSDLLTVLIEKLNSEIASLKGNALYSLVMMRSSNPIEFYNTVKHSRAL